MPSLRGLSREALTYSDLTASPASVKASLTTLEILLQESSEIQKRSNEAIVKHILQQMVQVGKFMERSQEYLLIDKFSRRVLNVPASSYVTRNVGYSYDPTIPAL
jgi:uncharacterized iron-regulated protein